MREQRDGARRGKDGWWTKRAVRDAGGSKSTLEVLFIMRICVRTYLSMSAIGTSNKKLASSSADTSGSSNQRLASSWLDRTIPSGLVDMYNETSFEVRNDWSF